MSSPEVSGLMKEVTGLLQGAGRDKEAEDLSRKTNVTRSGVPLVLVAGEDKRGKSSLVNALLSRRDLSPVGTEVVTGAPISMFFADPERASVVRYGEQKPTTVDLATAQSLATVQGNPQNRENIRAVQLGVNCPLLHRMMLVDTPGVGGLSSGHGELTLQSLQFADALLFVLEAGSQFRGAELEFLRRASSRIDTVVLAMTKVDLHRGWRTIMADNQKILQEQAPRLASCPFIPVSSLLALRTLTTDDPEEQAALREESGMVALEAALTDRVVERADVLGDSNLLREALWPLTHLDRAVTEQLESIATGGTSRGRLEEEQRRLQELGQDKGDWPRRLDSEVRKLTLQRSEDCALGISEIRRRYDARIKNADQADRDSLPGELVADLTALAGRLNQEAAERLTALVEAELSAIDSAIQLRESIKQVTTDRLSAQLDILHIGDSGMTGYDKMSVLSSFSSGRSFSVLLSGSGFGLTAGALIAPPVGIAIGIGLGGFYAFQAFRARSRQAFANEFRGWMAEQCSQTQVTVNTTFQRELIDLMDEMRQAVRDALTERETQIATSLKESQRLLEAETAKRKAAQEQLTQRRTTVRDLQRRALELLDKLRTDPTPDPPGAVAATGTAI